MTTHLKPSTLAYCYCDSPIGKLLLAGDGDGLALLSFPTGSRTKQPLDTWHQDASSLVEPLAQLHAYFAGELKQFDLPYRLNGTSFQKSVWMALGDIPFGQTTTYGQLATQIGRPKASRAVGAANGANPLPIILPCHRVIGSNNTLTGFGGGLETKQFLLELEGVAGLQKPLL